MNESQTRIAFIETCYQLYEQKMYQVAYRILHDSGCAEDAVQEAFFKLMRKKIYFEDAASDDCKRYLITVIKHASIDIYHKKRKEQEILYFPGEEDLMYHAADTQLEEDEFCLQEFISNLPPKYHSVVTCLALKHLSVKETANELGIKEATVRKRFERAKRMLKKTWKGSNAYETKYMPN